MNYYDLVVSNKVDKNIYRIQSVQRMTKDGDLTIEEAYSILYKAALGIDSTSDQASIITLLPPKEFNEVNALALNKILSALEVKGVRIELISVYNANDEAIDSGILAYVKLGKLGILNNFYQANLVSYVSEGTSITKIQLDLIKSTVDTTEMQEILGINTIELDYEASMKLGNQYVSNELPGLLKAFNIDYKVYGEFE